MAHAGLNHCLVAPLIRNDDPGATSLAMHRIWIMALQTAAWAGKAYRAWAEQCLRQAHKQCHAKLVLQGANMATDGRLREIQFFGRMSNVAFGGHGHKASQLRQIHGNRS